MNRRVVLLAGTAVIGAAAWRLIGDHGTAEAASDRKSLSEGMDEPALGINLTPISFHTPMVFLDRFKASPGWDTRDGPAPTDALGYPTGMNGQKQITTILPCEEGTYILSHDGDMDVRIQGGMLSSQQHGRSIYEVHAPIGNQRQVIIYAIRKPPTYMTLINQKDEAAFKAGEIFAPQFLAQLKNFTTLRFMDWMGTNGSNVTDSTVSIKSCTYGHGVPIEIMAMLARKIGAHPWICIPHLATDALAKQMIETLRTAMGNGPVPYIEYSNEVWNLAFEQARYAQRQAEAHWGAGTPGAVFYGYRAGQIALLARNSGCRVVLGTQTMTPARAASVWDGVHRSGATDHDFTAWIIATYITGTLTSQQGPTIALATQNNVTAAIDNLLHSKDPGAMSVATMTDVYAAHHQIAAAHGLKLVAYEGNLHLNAIPMFGAQKALVKPFFEAITKSPDSAAIMDANLSAFAAAGGSLACLYNLSSGLSDGGFFGVVDSGSWKTIQARLARHPAKS